MLGRKLRGLATHALDVNQLTKLAKSVKEARASARDLAPLTPFKLGILSNSTTALVAPALVGTALRFGIALEIVEAPFNQVMQQALQTDSVFSATRPDAVLLALDIRGVPLAPVLGDPAAADAGVDKAIAQFRVVRDGLRRNSGAVVIAQTLVRLPDRLFGSYDIRLPGTGRWMANAYNRALVENLEHEDLLVDVAALAELVGHENWHNAMQWNLAKLPFAQDIVPLYSDHVCRVIGALRGKSRRCLILDLDNTIWGGVIGDDGIEGIVIGQGSAVGEAHLSVQQAALALRERGIVLAVSSKNDDHVARGPFRTHADMLLREDHIAVFQANWIDKAANIRAIAEKLSLGLDSMVFLDDNPVERAQVRRELPEVAVPELPPDPAFYAQTLFASGYFEAIAFSEDDRKRAAFYEGNAERLALQGSASDMDEYLASLKMKITFQPFEPVGRSRIAQLVGKSNQFNLTTRRYSEADVASLEASPEHFTLQVRLTDAFGDNGMISVIICRKADREWEIDTWLMSCRVLGRCVEEAVLQEIVRAARREGVQRLVGRYIPTERNGMVAEHYAKLGFKPAGQPDKGITTWLLELNEAPREPVPMEIVHA